MTNDEIKEAFRRQCPVMHNGIEYKRIDAIHYRIDPYKHELIISAELLDKNRFTVVIAQVRDVHWVNEADGTGEACDL